MGISEWFTAFSLFLAVYALFSAEERRIISLKLNWVDSYLVVGTLACTIILIKYPEIYDRFDCLKNFNVSWGLDPKNWALLLFLGMAIFYAIKLFRIPEKLPSDLLIKYYQNLMKQDFKLFYKLFNKYEKNASQNQHFESYKSIIFEPAFLEGVSDQPYYYTNLLDRIDKATFKKYFTGLLNNHNSIFYKELAANSDFYLVEKENYFLYKLLHQTPGLFFRIGGLIILRDWHIKYLENEKLKRAQSIYNQSPDLVVQDFALSMPLYLHILFINLLYQEAIVQKIDTSMLANGYTNMQSIFSNMIEKMNVCIDIQNYQRHESAEYPLKYHYLIGEIFDAISGWLERFNEDDNYQVDNSLLSYFPSCMKWCIRELVKGYEQGVIPKDFVLRMIHYNLMVIYYKHDLKPELMNEIEQECILELPGNLIESILTFSLDESFALAIWKFKAGEFHHPGSNSHEMFIIERLYNLLKEHNLL